MKLIIFTLLLLNVTLAFAEQPEFDWRKTLPDTVECLAVNPKTKEVIPGAKIDFKESGYPYNTRLTLDFTLLKELMPLLQSEIIKGLVDTSGEDLVILHVNLTSDQVLLLNNLKKYGREKKIA